MSNDIEIQRILGFDGKLASRETALEVLKLKGNATEDEIRKSYKKLAVLIHPDKNQNNEKADDAFKILLMAHQIATSPNVNATPNNGNSQSSSSNYQSNPNYFTPDFTHFNVRIIPIPKFNKMNLNIMLHSVTAGLGTNAGRSSFAHCFSNPNFEINENINHVPDYNDNKYGQYNNQYQPKTMGNINFKLWDVSGTIKYGLDSREGINNPMFRNLQRMEKDGNLHASILCFSAARKDRINLNDIKYEFEELVKKKALHGINSIIVVATKVDASDVNKELLSQTQLFIESAGASYFATSAKTGAGYDDLTKHFEKRLEQENPLYIKPTSSKEKYIVEPQDRNSASKEKKSECVIS
ncbi:DnaJ domain-containing protein [Thiotrichales bacterium 19S9-12]|nr:DnaJ domain-containing protein [Thiotrichales bacterium 19S9-11]MCF6812608.1 DnaJ domain-containing protein [Thiotrichales bacterium 19S9-12]